MRPLALLLALLLPAATVAGAGPSEIEQRVADLAVPARRVAAMNELRQKKDPAAIPPLVDLVRTTHDSLVRYYGILVLDAYPPAASKGAFSTLVREETPYVRLAAATALYRMGERDMTAVIVKTLTLPDLEVNTRIRMLNRLNGFYDPKVRDAIQGLLAPGENLSVLGCALGVLSTTWPARSRTAVEGLLADPRPGAKAMAAAYLVQIGEEGRAAALAEALRTGEVGASEFFRVQSFLTRAARVSDDVLDAVEELVGKTEETFVATRGIELIAKCGYRKAIPLLRELLNREDEKVAKAAFDALATLSGGLDAPTLRPLLDSKQPIRRLWAADALRRMDEPVGLPIALALLPKGSDEVRREAARVLGGFRVAAVVDPLLGALADPNPTVRSAAFSSLSQVLVAIFPYRRLDLSSTGYQPSAAPAANAAAIATLEAWWKENRGKDW